MAPGTRPTPLKYFLIRASTDTGTSVFPPEAEEEEIIHFRGGVHDRTNLLKRFSRCRNLGVIWPQSCQNALFTRSSSSLAFSVRPIGPLVLPPPPPRLLLLVRRFTYSLYQQILNNRPGAVDDFNVVGASRFGWMRDVGGVWRCGLVGVERTNERTNKQCADVGSSMIAEKIVSLCRGYAKSLTVELGICLEGR